MSDFPRYRNGAIDDGKRISQSAAVCPHCGSRDYSETISRERCGGCGMECDYWGGGVNPEYEKYIQKLHRAEAVADEARMRQLLADME